MRLDIRGCYYEIEKFASHVVSSECLLREMTVLVLFVVLYWKCWDCKTLSPLLTWADTERQEETHHAHDPHPRHHAPLWPGADHDHCTMVTTGALEHWSAPASDHWSLFQCDQKIFLVLMMLMVLMVLTGLHYISVVSVTRAWSVPTGAAQCLHWSQPPACSSRPTTHTAM